jgi:hypothetical protein
VLVIVTSKFKSKGHTLYLPYLELVKLPDWPQQGISGTCFGVVNVGRQRFGVVKMGILRVGVVSE